MSATDKRRLWEDGIVFSRSAFINQKGKLGRLVYSPKSAQIAFVGDATAHRIDDLQTLITLIGKASTLSLFEKGMINIPGFEMPVDSSASRPAERRASFVLVPTSNCNMACSYCGQTHKAGKAGDIVSEKIVLTAENAVLSDDYAGVNLTWFGGEPLLALNRVVAISQRIKERCEAHNKSFRNGMVTNGVLLSPSVFHRLFDSAGITQYEVTVDGDRSIHNKRRPMKVGEKDSHTLIVNNLEYIANQFLTRPTRLTIRINVDRDNIHSIPSLLPTLKSKFSNREDVWVYFVPVHNWSNDNSDVLVDVADYAKQEASWIDELVKSDVKVPLVPDLIKSTTCTATDPDAVIIDYVGRIYNCTEHPLVNGTLMSRSFGTLGAVGKIPRLTDELSVFRDEVGNGSWPCSKCAFFSVCGGACPKHWHEGAVPCPPYKYNLPDRLDTLAISYGYQPQ